MYGMYGIFAYIYNKTQPNVGNISYMDGVGNQDLENIGIRTICFGNCGCFAG